MKNIMDKLFEEIELKGHVCLGLDTDISYLPEDFKNLYENEIDAIISFNKKVIDNTIDVVAAYKVQIAYYEALGTGGMRAYKETVKYIKAKNALSIGDIKRGDIKKTAEMYAKAHFEGDFEVDFITLNPYMGMDTIEPFLPYLEKGNKGIFALIATSNHGAKDIEHLNVDGRKLYEIVGEKIETIGKEYLGEHGYSAIGGVVGCRNVEETKNIRENLNTMFFLIPGYGAQGGTAKDIAYYLKNGNAGVVNSSRGILLAYKKEEHRGESFYEAARNEAIRMKEDILSALK